MTQIKAPTLRVTSPANVVSPRARIRPFSAEPAKPSLPERPRNRRNASFKKADVARAISAAAKAGFVAGSVEVTRDGTIRIYAPGAEPKVSLFDQWADKL